jgi:hypothetical protein
MKILSKSGMEFQRLELPKVTNHYPCNPSVIISGNRIMVSYRGCNYSYTKPHGFVHGSRASQVPDSQNYIAQITDEFICKSVDFIEDRHVRAREDCLDGLEDLRLFEWRDEIYAIGAGTNWRSRIEKTTPLQQSTMIFGKLRGRIFDPITPFLTNQHTEKNWMPWVIADRLYFIYAPHPLIILEYSPDEKRVKVVETKSEKTLPHASGSSCMVPFDGNFVGVLHVKVPMGKNTQYRHRLFLASEKFEILAVSEEFSFEGKNIEFCAGIAVRNGYFYLSYGVFDEKAIVMKISTEKAMAFLFS